MRDVDFNLSPDDRRFLAVCVAVGTVLIALTWAAYLFVDFHLG